MVTAYRPIDETAKRGPARAVGLAYLKRDMSARTLKVAIDAPEKIEPRRKVDVTLSVTGAANEKVFVTLAAVDEGILSLTGYVSPSPAKHYFGPAHPGHRSSGRLRQADRRVRRTSRRGPDRRRRRVAAPGRAGCQFDQDRLALFRDRLGRRPGQGDHHFGGAGLQRPAAIDGGRLDPEFRRPERKQDDGPRQGREHRHLAPLPGAARPGPDDGLPAQCRWRGRPL